MRVCHPKSRCPPSTTHLTLARVGSSCHVMSCSATPPFPPDSMGLHKVGNPTDSVSVTLHLYAPPYTKCRMWLDPTAAKDVQVGTISYNSRFGELTEY